MKRILSFICISLSVFATAAPAAGDDSRTIEKDVTAFSLEQLMDTEIYSAGRRSQKVADIAAAAFVLTKEDIRRSGALTIPELLRLVPGLQVARTNAHVWAVSARGFNDVFANKLLVLVDGRSVYTPLFAGVYWDKVDVPLEDIERIEVIRGPGAALWGSNAVNGVINIITKQASDTKGALVSGGAGSDYAGFGTVRYGDSIGENFDYRVYSKYLNHNDFDRPEGGSARDQWETVRSGFRADAHPSDRDSLTVLGDWYYGQEGLNGQVASIDPPFVEALDKNTYIGGQSLVLQWARELSKQSDFQVQFYYDRDDRDDILIDQSHDTYDLEAQHHLQLFEGNDLLYGAEYRLIHDDLEGIPSLRFDPRRRDFDLFTGFVQDEMSLIDGWLKLIVGSKFEHNDFTGFEYQPNGRILVTPTPTDTVWAAVSRAVRTPSRSDNDIINTQSAGEENGILAETISFGSDDVLSESLIAYEVGYRTEFSPRYSIDISAFYNDYGNLITGEFGDPFETMLPDGRSAIINPINTMNLGSAETYGFEVSADLRPLDWWRLSASYALLQVSAKTDADATAPDTTENLEGDSPKNQFIIRSLTNITDEIEFDGMLRYVDNLSTIGVSTYFELDLRLAWHVTPDLEASAVVQNLLDSSHQEFSTEFVDANVAEVDRAAYGKLTWRY